MIKASSTVKLNMVKIAQLTRTQVTALEQTAEALHTKIVQAQVVPRDTGNLQNESFFVDNSSAENGIASLVHDAPYARRLYFHPELHFSKAENPNARAHWFEDWEQGGSEEQFAINTYKEIYRRLNGL